VHPSVDGSDKLFHNSLHGNRYGEKKGTRESESEREREREEIDFAPRSRSLAGRFANCAIFSLRAFKDADVINVLARVITRIILHIKERERERERESRNNNYRSVRLSAR